MANKTKQQLIVENNTSFPTNNAGAITATELRDFNTDMIDSTVNQGVYTTDSASFDSRIDAIIIVDTGSLLVTASFASQNLTFTKGDGSQFSVFIPDDSGSIIPSGTVSGSSQIILQDTTGDLSGSRIDGEVALALNSTYAQNTITTGKNLHNTTIDKGTPLFFTGSGTSGNLVGVYPADAGDPTRMPAGGIAGESIAVGDEGIVLLDGYIGGVDTSTFGSGDEIFVAVGGGYTNVPPTGSALIQHLGNVEKSAINGSGVIQMMGEVRGLPNIQEGYLWVGDSNGVPQAVASSSIQTELPSGLLSSSVTDFATYTSSVQTEINGLSAETSSYAKTNVNNTFTGTQTFDNIAVNGTGSFAYIESITGSAKIIGDAFIILNNNTPTERYAGIIVIDSGSTNTTASLQFDGQTNDWFYEYTGSDPLNHGVVMFGPEYGTKGSPTYPSNNTILKGNGGHHVLDSNILDDGSTVSINSNTQITGSLTINGNQPLIGSDLSSLNSFTESADIRLDNIELETSSLQSQINVLSGVTGSYATTGSNTFVGNQIFDTSKLYLSGSGGSSLLLFQYGNSQIRFYSGSDETEVGTWINLQSNPANGALAISSFPENNHFVDFDPFLTQSLFTAPIRLDGGIEGSVIINGGLTVNNNLVVTGSSVLANTNVNGNVSINNSLEVTGSSVFGSPVTVNNDANLAGNVSIGNVLEVTGSAIFASPVNINNNLVVNGSQTISGSVQVSGSVKQTINAPTAGNQTDFISVNGVNIDGTPFNYVNFGIVDYPGAGNQYKDAFNIEYYDSLSYNYGGEFTVNPKQIGASIFLSGSAFGISQLRDLGGNKTFLNQYASVIQLGALASQTTDSIWIGHNALPVLRLSSLNNEITGSTIISGSSGLKITGSIDVTGELTSSLQEGYVWVGDVSGRTTTVSTGSFGGGGGASFPYSGSVEITGSVKVKPYTLSVVSSTASIDMNESNYFILNLPTGTTTHVDFTNIIPGESINLLVSQSSGVTTGSIDFAPNIYFPAGNNMVATQTGSARDIVSFITFNQNEIYATSVKNLY